MWEYSGGWDVVLGSSSSSGGGRSAYGALFVAWLMLVISATPVIAQHAYEDGGKRQSPMYG